MISDLNFNDIETTDIKASYKVSQILWALLDAVSTGDDEDDALSFFDRELLEDVLRFGTIAEVARRKEESYQKVRVKLIKVLYRISDKIEQINTQKEENLKIKERLAVLEDKHREQDLELLDTKARLYQTQNIYKEMSDKLSKTEKDLAQTQAQLSQNQKELTLKKAQLTQNQKGLAQIQKELAQLQKEKRTKLEKAKIDSEAAQKEAKLLQKKLEKKTAELAYKEQTNTELNVRLEMAMDTIKSLRRQEGADYKILYEAALETIERQRKENRALEDFLIHIESEPLKKRGPKQGYQIRRLKARVAALEKSLMNYKTQGISAILDFEPE